MSLVNKMPHQRLYQVIMIIVIIFMMMMIIIIIIIIIIITSAFGIRRHASPIPCAYVIVALSAVTHDDERNTAD